MDSDKKRVINLMLAVLLVLTLTFIWGNSLLSREKSAEASNGVLDMFSELFERLGVDIKDDHWLRETAHFGEFCVLGCELALLFFVNRGHRFSSAIFAASSALAVALIDEGLQIFSHRAAELKDVAMDFIGAVFSIALIGSLLALWKGRKQ